MEIIKVLYSYTASLFFSLKSNLYSEGLNIIIEHAQSFNDIREKLNLCDFDILYYHIGQDYGKQVDNLREKMLDIIKQHSNIKIILESGSLSYWPKEEIDFADVYSFNSGGYVSVLVNNINESGFKVEEATDYQEFLREDIKITKKLNKASTN
jgi:hypothetical protein